MIPKAASDCAVCIIEGLADRDENIDTGIRDYSAKLYQLFLDGIIGRNSSKGFAFCLNRYRKYLTALKQIALRDYATPASVAFKGWIAVL